MAIYDVIDEKAILGEAPPTQAKTGGEGIYRVLEGPQEGDEGKGEGGKDYEELEDHLLEVGGGEGLTYDVPIPTIPAAAQPVTQQVTEPMEYSTLQHQ